MNQGETSGGISNYGSGYGIDPKELRHLLVRKIDISDA